jgi:hypothetical protein
MSQNIKDLAHPGLLLVVITVMSVAFYLPQEAYIDDYENFQLSEDMTAYECTSTEENILCEDDITLSQADTPIHIQGVTIKTDYDIPEEKMVCLEDAQLLLKSQWICLTN